MRARGFTLLEVVVALALVGVGVTALLLAMAQGRRTFALTRRWAQEERRATDLLFSGLQGMEQLRTAPARQAGLIQRGQDGLLGAWEWKAEPLHRIQGRPVDLYRVSLSWTDQGRSREVETHAVLRVPAS